jgi:secreted PhoX family phosphatase
MDALELGSEGGISRRSLLGRSAAGGVGIAMAGGLSGLFGAQAQAGNGNGAGGGGGYGPLVPDPDGLLSLPECFTYSIIDKSGVTLLESGEPTPSDPDGMASFVRHRGNGSVLVYNHEISGSEPFPVPHPDGLVYDDTAKGGTTTLEVDRHGKRIREYVSVAGTNNNCAGGRTPWDTWLTCEETETVTGKPHGYVFEVDPYRLEPGEAPKPIKAMGRYAHESLAVDPHRGRIYLTEDASNPNGLMYRFTPPDDALPLRRGSLRALADDAGDFDAMKAFTTQGDFVPDLSVAVDPGTKYGIEWVPVPERDATTTSTRKQLDEITRSRKLEGMWWGDGGAYFVASFARTSDGSAVEHDGQVWFLDPLAHTIELKVRFAYTPEDQDNDPDGPDNITVSPYGGVIMAEDGDGVNHLMGATDDGEVFAFARNEDAGNSEFTGPTFSHDRKTLYACIQSPGWVFAIHGPFRKQ